MYNSQNATPDIQRQVDEAQGGRHPRHHDHRDARARGRDVPAVAGRAAEGARRRPCTKRPGRDALPDGARRRAASTDAEDVIRARGAAVALRRAGRSGAASTSSIGPGTFTVILGPNGVGQVHAAQGAAGLQPLSGGTVSVLGEPAGASAARIGYVPQRRAFDPSVRIRGLDVVRLGLDGTRWGIPLPGGQGPPARDAVDELGRLVEASQYARPPDRPTLRGRAAAADHRPGAGARAAAAAAGRATGQPGPQQPGRGGRAGPADLPRAGRDGRDGRPRREPDPALPRRGGLPGRGHRGRRPAGGGHHQRDAERAVRARTWRCFARPTAGWSSSASPKRPRYHTRPARGRDRRWGCSSYPFMVNALRAGTIVAVMAGALGWFMVLRRQTFAGHTLSLVGFPGAAGAILLGLSAALGYFALLHRRGGRHRRASPPVGSAVFSEESARDRFGPGACCSRADSCSSTSIAAT